MKRLLILLSVFSVLCACAQDKEKVKITPPKNQTKVEYGTGENNWLNVYPVSGDKPCAVYVWGHPNSDGKVPPSANDISTALVATLNAEGIAVISWESVPQVKSHKDVTTCESDLERVYQWIQKNGATYNIDTDNIFIGGASRGSVVSWRFINENPEKVRGGYFAQALPKGAWADQQMTPRKLVTDKSPKVIFTYRDAMDTTDGHSPKFGQIIVDRYKELNIEDRITMYTEQGKLLYKYLPEFIKANLKK